MINLPPGFDLTLFIDNIVTICTPFVEVAALFAAFLLIKKIGNRI